MPLQRLTDLCRGVPLPSRHAAACLLVLAAGLGVRPAAAPALGRVEGYVHLTSASVRPVPSGVYPSRRVSVPLATPGPDMQNVVVFIKDAPTPDLIPVTKATIAQKDEAFVPGVVAITNGSTVVFPNFDPYFHNVFSLSRAASFDLGRFARGDSRTRRFTASGLVKVLLPHPFAYERQHHGVRPHVLSDPGRRRLVFTRWRSRRHLSAERVARTDRRERASDPGRGRPTHTSGVSLPVVER